MTYRPTPDHDELRAVVRELADERIAPRAAEIDATSEFPWDLKELLAKQDLLGIAFPARFGERSSTTSRRRSWSRRSRVRIRPPA